MKILGFEKVVKEFDGSYEYCYSDDGTCMFVSYYTDSTILLDSDLQKIKRIVRKCNKAKLRYIGRQEDGTLSLEFIIH